MAALGPRVRGFLYMLASTTCFALMAATSKKIGKQATSNEKLFWRALLVGGMTLGQNILAGVRIAWPRRPLIALLRGLCGHWATMAYLESIERLPLAEAAFLGKIHPLAAAVIARIFLGERLHTWRVVAIFVALGGTCFIAMPSADGLASGSALGVSLALFAGVLTGAAYCCVRALARAGELELWIVLAFPLVSGPIGVPDTWRGITTRGMSPSLALWLLLMGIVTQAAQVCLTRGLKLLPAAAGTQVMFLGGVVSILLGAMMGDGWPGWQFYVGGAIIGLSLQLAQLAEGEIADKQQKD
mmetsp:Transcript_77235/g.174719  ORF Transcript_77235/g.174719 Transcript_77235/m.174719 type:complete len:300 (+) Transcript_77235:80-979(+)|eukprot:CAMPEP_0197891612 /NCGR_PEP_ID=MMETSP1439-20131203/29078_1 /TAXON_ID=66791 /ORGANISM="Gonyaulax spinifera, Strain CCMP409" /LENGTH=299 /DNA_ID=CAMNT_0043511727 /DNA_START=80 /DNA_END=979 /DNA_ORIENTATION=+